MAALLMRLPIFGTGRAEEGLLADLALHRFCLFIALKLAVGNGRVCLLRVALSLLLGSRSVSRRHRSFAAAVATTSPELHVKCFEKTR